MSIVAYRDGIICSDGRMTINDMILSDSYKKIVKRDGAVAGFVGDAEHCAALMRWFTEKFDLNTIPQNKGSGLVILDRTIKKKKAVKILMIEEGGYFEVGDDFYARGTGREVALGAMLMGATAYEAVEASIKRINTTGGEIYVEELW